jgi:general secretion pathway protein A
MERPQSSLSDLCREMGHLFGASLSPANRYGGFKALRERWQEHIKSTLFRPVLLVDEAQEMVTCCLNELRAGLDSQVPADRCSQR